MAFQPDVTYPKVRVTLPCDPRWALQADPVASAPLLRRVRPAGLVSERVHRDGAFLRHCRAQSELVSVQLTCPPRPLEHCQDTGNKVRSPREEAGRGPGRPSSGRAAGLQLGFLTSPPARAGVRARSRISDPDVTALDGLVVLQVSRRGQSPLALPLATEPSCPELTPPPPSRQL